MGRCIGGYIMFESSDLSYHKNRLYGLYRAYVYDNKDPENLGRLKLCIPSAYGSEGDDPLVSDWIYPAFPVNGWQFGLQCIPPVKNKDGTPVLVWVAFEQGDKEFPVWFGGPVSENGLQENVKENHEDRVNGVTNKCLFCWSSPSGHKIILNDQKHKQHEKKCVVIQSVKGNKIIFDDKDGRSTSITIETPDGHSIIFDDESDKITATVEDKFIELSKDGIIMKGDVTVIGSITSTKDMVCDSESKPVSQATHIHMGEHGKTTTPLVE